VSRYETLLFLHLLAAVAIFAGVVLFAAILLGVRRFSAAGDAAPLLRLAGPATALWNVGGLGVLVFGVWMAIDLDGYDLLDGWVIAAIVLWFVASGAGGPLARDYQAAREEAPDAALAAVRTPRMAILHVVMAAAVLALLVVMIYKPGA
jgi:hypothetical protein